MTVAEVPRITPQPQRAVVIAAILIAVGCAGFVLAGHSHLGDRLTWILVVVATVSGLAAESSATNLVFAPSFVCAMLAIAFLDPAAAFLVALIPEIIVWTISRYRWQAFLINLAGIPLPTLVVASGFAAVDPARSSLGFYALLAAATAATLLLNIVAVVAPLVAILDGQTISSRLRAWTSLLPTILISVALTLAVAVAYQDYGTKALLLLVLAIATIAYMSHLVAQSRDQARQYANLSWGVLSALVRTLNERDDRAARHCAAVAMFSRDMARACGLGQREQELAHTAGLLHDIGKFVLSDRVMERGAQLDEVDWRGIRRHPDIGADLLRDIGVFGPIGDIIRAHHERIDGRGYPNGLRGEEIPEVAKIVAVAEVYDTLTAPDTYRTPMTSFEALNELQRVSGAQLESKYVDALSELLAGRGTDYRHQNEADFDVELSIERRMAQAAVPT